ncbi:hypothetical protein NLJ89_g202 [Agrocybe chaxingu]|uniref:XPA C-terminal domain-containing protein n=1 Tax=Agrocybe chaxingu TaxID=84603 RepID=A0A9W8N2B4_9AGAR|nr:hypothetical protein NLJ89_g202 [Agrocybe chaxingu]
MGAEAQAFADEAYELYVKPFAEDAGTKFTDPAPANGTSMKRVERPESEWDETKWPKSKLKAATLIPKGRAKSEFLLTDKDMLPLSYCKKKNSQGYNCMKMYNKREVERRAWDKYGGPNGLDAALAFLQAERPRKWSKTGPSVFVAEENEIVRVEEHHLG